MKKYLVIAIFGCLTLLSCNDDFKVGANYKDITVVFGLLSHNETTHYIKITKGFYDEKQDNLLLAKIPDSIYFKNLDVKLERLQNGNVVATKDAKLVDLVQLGIVKDTGIFAHTPNYAYEIKDSLYPTLKYRLRIKNLSNGKEITGETDIINSSQMIFQNPFINTQPLNFAQDFENSNFSWSAPPEAVFFDLVMRFYYQEIDNNTLVTTYKFKDLPLALNVPALGAGSITTLVFNNATFYAALNSELKAAPSYISRKVDTPDLMILAGGQILRTYIDATGAQGGITYDQIKPNYTNLKGEDVLGILSTRAYRVMKEIPFTKSTFDSIISGSLTRNLNFVGISSE